jgi:hypothetical protein
MGCLGSERRSCRNHSGKSRFLLIFRTWQRAGWRFGGIPSDIGDESVRTKTVDSQKKSSIVPFLIALAVPSSEDLSDLIQDAKR